MSCVDCKNSLLDASSNGHLDCVQYLIESGSDVLTKDEIGMTSLMYASKYGHLDCVQYLIESGSDVLAKNNDGQTALMLASKNEYSECVEFIKNVIEKWNLFGS